MEAPDQPRIEPPRAPQDFQRAVREMGEACFRSEVYTEQMPAPQRIAPFASALSADVTVRGEELATGRIVVLHDPAGNDAWEGTFRCVAYVRAEIDTEQAADPVLAAVAWSYLTESLEERGACYAAPSGSVTCVTSESFGGMAEEPPTAQVEIRASWSPVGSLTPHVEAWGDLLCHTASLEPVPEGVATMPSRRQRGRS